MRAVQRFSLKKIAQVKIIQLQTLGKDYFNFDDIGTLLKKMLVYPFNKLL